MKEQEYIIEEGNEPIPCEMYIDMVIFSEEEDFIPSDLTNKIQIQPSKTGYKGDLIHENLYRKETCWRLETSRIKTWDFEEIFMILMRMLGDKTGILGKYAKENNLSIKIYPVIVVYNNMPSIIITKEIAETLLLLNATIEFDMYFAE
jgi:hypothetical protein